MLTCGEEPLDSDKAGRTADVYSEGERSKDDACVMVQMTM